MFAIHPKLGSITVPNPRLLTRGTSYEFQAIAADQDEQSGKPASIRVTIKNAPLKPFQSEEEIAKFEDEIVYVERRALQDDQFEDEIVYVEKRALRDDRIFVVRSTQDLDLFSVASVPPVDEERYNFAEPAPEGLTMDEVTGMVTRESGHTWNSSMETFFVNITRIDDPGCK